MGISSLVVSGAPDLAEFASDLAQVAEAQLTAHALAEVYLDQYWIGKRASGMSFQEALKAFEPFCAYYV